MVETNVPATGNTPTGNPGAGTRETTSAPNPVGTTGSTTDATGPAGGAPSDVGTSGVQLTDADFKKDGDLRADAVRRIEENTPARGAERSFNEITDETTVTTVVDGRTVTFTESGDTRNKE